MTDDSALVRQWKILAELAASQVGLSVNQLATEHAVGIKTIRRDLITLKESGFPLEESLGDHGRKFWKLEEAGSLPSVSLDWMEAMSLSLVMQLTRPVLGPEFGDSAANAFSKIRATLGAQPLKYLRRMSNAFYVTQQKLDHDPSRARLIDDLTHAIEEKRIVQLTYRSEKSTEATTRDLYPLLWVFNKSSPYLIAHAPDHNERRIYKLDRMEAVYVTRMQFQGIAEISAEEFLSGTLGVFRGEGKSFQRVRVRFHPSVARAAKETHVHRSQQMLVQPDGSVIAEFRLSTFVELKSWILSWGKNAEALEPTELVDELRAEAAALHAMYSKANPSRPRAKALPRRRPR